VLDYCLILVISSVSSTILAMYNESPHNIIGRFFNMHTFIFGPLALRGPCTRRELSSING
jgi:hypothetical protein